MLRFFAVLFAFFLLSGNVQAADVTILALGDSLTAGLGLEAPQSFPARLEAALRQRGHDVAVINGGVSGDTMADGAARLEWSLAEEVDAVIVELGANDALRGLDPTQAEAALAGILSKLEERRLPVLVAGMRAPPNLGADYQHAFDGIYARLAQRHGALLYPFFLDGVAAQPSLNQPDGLHPNAPGVDIIVSRIMPSVEALIRKTTGK
jgi:acyl-CoA thioesterase-1